MAEGHIPVQKKRKFELEIIRRPPGRTDLYNEMSQLRRLYACACLFRFSLWLWLKWLIVREILDSKLFYPLLVFLAQTAFLLS